MSDRDWTPEDEARVEAVKYFLQYTEDVLKCCRNCRHHEYDRRLGHECWFFTKTFPLPHANGICERYERMQK